VRYGMMDRVHSGMIEATGSQMGRYAELWARLVVARHIAFNASVSYLGLGLSLLSAPILAQTLGADGRGVIAGSLVVVQVVGWIAFLGLPRGIALQIEKRREIAMPAVVLVGALGMLSALLVFLAAPVLSNDDDRIEMGMRIASGVLVLAGLSSIGDQTALLRGRLWIYNSIRGCTLILPSCGIIVLSSAGQLTLETAFIVSVAGQVGSVAIGALYALSSLRWLSRAAIPWRFSLQYWTASVFDSVGGRADQLILTAISTPAAVGLYAVAVTCSGAASGLAQALNQTIYARLVRDSKNGQTTSLNRISYIGVGATLFIGALIMLVVWLFWRQLFGPTFDGLVPVLGVLIVASVLSDQWRLRVYFDSARENGAALAVSSIVGLVTMIIAVTLFAAAGLISPLSIAISYALLCAMRIVSRIILVRLKRERKQMKTQRNLMVESTTDDSDVKHHVGDQT
jgi:O-antigen/teichoic acid export membrane protein